MSQFCLVFFFSTFFFLNLLFLNPSYGKQHDTFKGMQNNIQSTLIKLNEKIIIIFLEPGKYVSKWMSCFRFFFFLLHDLFSFFFFFGGAEMR